MTSENYLNWFFVAVTGPSPYEPWVDDHSYTEISGFGYGFGDYGDMDYVPMNKLYMGYGMKITW